MDYLKSKFSDSFTPKPIRSLDGIRAVSCMFVIVGHFSYLYSHYFINLLGPVWGATVTFMLGNQYTGVTFFFVLSGFLITNILIDEIKRSKTINIKSFIVKRAFRIFPAYYFYLASIVLFLSFNHAPAFTSIDVLAAATYTYNYFSDLNPWHMGHLWSLAVEEQFYLFWPILFLFSYKKWRQNFTLTLVCLYPLIRLGCYYMFPEMRARMSIMGHTRMDSLLFGCLLAYYYKVGYFPQLDGVIKKFKLHIVALAHILFLSRLLQMTFVGKYTMTAGYSLDCLAMCIVIVNVVQSKNLLSRLLNAPIMVHIGTLSYSLYLWHLPFTWSQLGTDHLLLRFAGIYVLALASYLLIESPMMDLRKKYFSKRLILNESSLTTEQGSDKTRAS